MKSIKSMNTNDVDEKHRDTMMSEIILFTKSCFFSANMFDKFAREDERKKLAEKRAKMSEPNTIKQAAEEARKAEAMETSGEEIPSKDE